MREPDRLAAGTGWPLLAAGLLLILGGLIAIRTGKAPQVRRHRWGFTQDFDIERERSPAQFWIHITLYFLIGAAVLVYGASELFRQSR